MLSLIILKAKFLQRVLDEAPNTYLIAVAMCSMFVENLSSDTCEDARQKTAEGNPRDFDQNKQKA